MAGNQELSFSIGNVNDFAGNRGAVHVHIKDVEKNADSRPLGLLPDTDHLAVSRGNRNRSARDFPVGIAKKPQTEKGQQVKRRTYP